MQTIIFQIQSTLILVILLYGATLPKKNRLLHRKVMLTGIIWDLLLILQIELTRHALNTASKMATNPWLMNYHISIAISCVLGYFILIYSGSQVLKGNLKIRPLHKNIAYITLFFRISTYITSYLIK